MAVGARKAISAVGAPRLLAVGLVYFLFAATLAVLALFARTNFALQLGGQLVIDLIMISLLLAIAFIFCPGLLLFARS